MLSYIITCIMDLQKGNKMVGVVNGLYYGQQERVDELNERIQSRNLPDSPLAPNFDFRSTPTRYTDFSTIDTKKTYNEPILPYPTYNSGANFNPGNSSGPVSGYSSNVATETMLRNQHFALQNGSDQGVYVPSSNSTLYKTTVVSRPSEQPYPMLFKQDMFSQVPHPNVHNSVIGNDKFFNHTRTQLRNSA